MKKLRRKELGKSIGGKKGLSKGERNRGKTDLKGKEKNIEGKKGKKQRRRKG